MNILIVDDEPGTRLMVAAAVERLGHRVLQAADGDRGLAARSSCYRPEVVITDWAMPGLDGTELAARIRADRGRLHVHHGPDRRAPTRHASREAVQAGADDVLAKPPDPAELERGLIAAERLTAMHRRMLARRAPRPADRRRLPLAARRGPRGAVRARRRATGTRTAWRWSGSSRATSERCARAGRGARAARSAPATSLYRSGAGAVRRAAARAGAGHREPRRRRGCGGAAEHAVADGRGGQRRDRHHRAPSRSRRRCSQLAEAALTRSARDRRRRGLGRATAAARCGCSSPTTTRCRG